eukprot:COSAG05_NODE_2441_length_3061_cov_1.950034_1_plen_582_part_00
MSPRMQVLHQPAPPAPREVIKDTELQLPGEAGPEVRVRLNSPRLSKAMRMTGITLEDIKPIHRKIFVLEAVREGKTRETADRVGTKRFNVSESIRQANVATLLAVRTELVEGAVPTPPEKLSVSPPGSPQPLTAEESSARAKEREMREKTLHSQREKFEKEKNRLEQEANMREWGRQHMERQRIEYMQQKEQKANQLQEKRNKAFHDNFERALVIEEQRSQAVEKAKLDEVARVQANATEETRRQSAREEEEAKQLAFTKRQLQRVESTRRTWSEIQQNSARQREEEARVAEKQQQSREERMQEQQRAALAKQVERAQKREEKIKRCKEMKKAAQEKFLAQQELKSQQLSARLAAKEDGQRSEVLKKAKEARAKAARQKAAEDAAYQLRIQKSLEVDAHRAKAHARREEQLEERALLNRIEREVKAGKVKREERVMMYKYEEQIEQVEDKHRKLDRYLEMKKAFLDNQAVLAQQFFKQKLQLKSQQEKEWLKAQQAPLPPPPPGQGWADTPAAGSTVPQAVAAQRSKEEMAEDQQRILARCEELSVPARKREKVESGWYSRGDNPNQGIWRYKGARMNFYA